MATNETESLFAAPGAGVAPPVPSLLRWGPVVLRPHVLYRFIYGDGIQSAPGHPVVTAINELSPGILFDIGNHWHLDYTPTLSFYSASEFRDTVNHAVSLDGATAYENWTFGLSQRYSLTSQPLIETASQPEEQNLTTVLSSTCVLSTKTSLELSLNQDLRFTDQSGSSQNLNDYNQWSTLDWLNYQFWPKFGAALGLGGGYVHVKVGSDQTFEQVQGRINWRVQDKLTFSGSGGFEARQFLSSEQSTLLSPIYSLSMIYHLFEPTTISVTGNGTVSPSYFQDQVTQNLGINASLHQRLLEKLFLDVSGGYSSTTYKGATTLQNPNRSDNYTTFNVRLSCVFLKRASASVFYDWSDNSSSEAGFSYTSNQVGFELGYRL